jgi:hypothetical protein
MRLCKTGKLKIWKVAVVQTLNFMFLILLKPALILPFSVSFGLNKSSQKHSGHKATS